MLYKKIDSFKLIKLFKRDYIKSYNPIKSFSKISQRQDLSFMKNKEMFEVV